MKEKKDKRVVKFLIVGFVIAAIVLLCGVLFAVNAFVGNPIGSYKSKKAAEKYIEENYPNQGFYVDDVKYDFKSSGYCAFVKKENSADTYFEVRTDAGGNFNYSNAEDNLRLHLGTFDRINREYSALIRTALDALTADAAKAERNIDGFGLIIDSAEASEEASIPGVVYEELVPDKDYDVTEVGKTAGVVYLDVDTTDLSNTHAAELLLKVKELLDAGGIGFATVNVSLTDRNYEQSDGSGFDVSYFSHVPCSAITEDGLADRIENYRIKD